MCVYLMQLIFLFLLKGTSGVEYIHVFGKCGDDVSLPANEKLSDCTNITWHTFGGTLTIDLFNDEKIKSDNERLSLASDCSLNIKNITKDDYGIYPCVIREKKETRVLLHVLYVFIASTHTKIRPGRSLTLICHLYGHFFDFEKVQLVWVNQAGVAFQTDPRYRITSLGHSSSILTTTLLSKDNNTKLRCQVIKGSEVKTSDTFTVKYSAAAPTASPINVTTSQCQGDSSSEASITPARVIIFLGEITVLTAPTAMLLQIILERRADNKRKAKTPRGNNDTNA
ncbi:uncharacterized protein [Paramisgurnus dabryanus]|uniref:uncharacterized protein n=1 Tax=Paramisgurnus dabryanus TaxID=90735 RepID=UPI0031F3C242